MPHQHCSALPKKSGSQSCCCSICPQRLGEKLKKNRKQILFVFWIILTLEEEWRHSIHAAISPVFGALHHLQVRSPLIFTINADIYLEILLYFRLISADKLSCWSYFPAELKTNGTKSWFCDHNLHFTGKQTCLNMIENLWTNGKLLG